MDTTIDVKTSMDSHLLGTLYEKVPKTGFKENIFCAKNLGRGNFAWNQLIRPYTPDIHNCFLCAIEIMK